MNASFPRIITLLRKERGYSQKKAAADLGISQALLSHYEKGIRECGLDFVVRTADYYSVSCDYLLGRTADKSGAMIHVDAIPDDDPAIQDNHLRGGVLPVLNKKLVINSLHVLFDMLQKCNNKALTTEASAALTLTVYCLFRQIYAANPHNPAAMFSMDKYLFQAASLGEISKAIARSGELARGKTVEGEEGVKPDNLPDILPDDIARQYPMFSTSLLNLLRNAESRMQMN
ncbi:MAG: helix-turn-helix transcriptional regulator [Clostridia bacterium]|nr:helix-turn-helix transcriptional regulator [Clostridia bacterium]